MTSVSQLVPTFIQGISDQPDELKKPGQVRDLVNVSPDITNGLQKRAGKKFIADLQTDRFGSWFEIERESVEGRQQKFICKVGYDRSVEIWNANTGEPCDVFYSENAINADSLPLNINTQSYLQYTDQLTYLQLKLQENQRLQPLTVNDFTFVCNPDIPVSMSASEPIDKFEAFVELTLLAYNRAYDLDINVLSTDNISSYTVASNVVIDDVKNQEKDASCGQQTTFVHTFDYGDRNSDESVSNSLARDLRVQIRSVGQVYQSGNGNSSDDFECSYTHFIELQSGGAYWKKGDKVSLKANIPDVNDPTYIVEVTDVKRIRASSDIIIRGISTPSDASTVISASDILDSLREEIKDKGYECEVYGNGLHIVGDEPFVITTTEDDLFNILSQDDTEDELDDDGNIVKRADKIMVVNNVANLPRQCKKGIVAKVQNTFSDQDDYYVEFTTTDGTEDSGDGYWEEVAKPGEEDTFNHSTMPIAIVKAIHEVDGIKKDSFVATCIDWNKRTVGTAELFNPSFNNRTINNMLFYRNRLAFLSAENVIMSKANDLFNFFPSTALTVAPNDPIDISCSTKASSVLHDGIVVNNGLILFSAYNQFNFTTDSDILSPNTAKSSEILAYDYNIRSKPFYINTNVGFLGDSGVSTRMYEASNIFREGQVDVNERSKIVERSIAPDLTIVGEAKERGFVTLGKEYSDTIWCYRYFKQNSQQDIQSAWFKWVLPDGLLYHFMDESSYYAVTSPDDNTSYLVRSSLTDADTLSTSYGNTYNSYDYLDYWFEPTMLADGKSFTTPYPVDGYELCVYDSTGFTELSVIEATGNQVTLSMAPDAGSRVICGVKFTYSMELPTLYLNKRELSDFRSDTSASLVIHRTKFSFGPIGAYDIKLERLGKDDYDITYESKLSDSYLSNAAPVAVNVERTVPVYERNHNYKMTISSDYPTPTTIYSMRWEGDYNNRYYARV